MNPLFWVSVDLEHVHAYSHWKLHDSFVETKTYPVFAVQQRKPADFLKLHTEYYILDRNWQFRWIPEKFFNIVATPDECLEMAKRIK